MNKRPITFWQTTSFAILLYCQLIGLSASAQSHVVIINTKRVGALVPKTLFGLNLSDINGAFDGGLYAEMIQNRSFDFDFPWLAWTPFGNVRLENTKPYFDQNPRFARFTYGGEPIDCGIENSGFGGIALKSGESYRFSCYARTSGNCTHKLKVELVSSENELIASKTLDLTGKNWVKYVTTITSPTSTTNAKLRLTSLMRGVVDVDQVSLFPTKAFLEENNGLRNDIAQTIANAKPQLLRFPGGNVLDRKNRVPHFDWKKSIGKIGNRPSSISRWSYAVPEKRFVDYYQTNGFGIFEFLTLCENIEASPVLVIDCGLSALREQKSEKKQNQSEWLDANTQDALDLIEFANGDENSTWGEKRAAMGHSESFAVKYISIADNPKTEAEFHYLSSFVESIRKRYPKIELCGSAGVNPDAKELEYRTEFLQNCNVKIIDEQLFRSPEWLLAQAKRYDDYERNDTRIVIGEFAAVADNQQNSFAAAVAEAAFMTGVERNCDVVQMCSYATTLANIHAWQCSPNLIWFDKTNAVKTASYFVQKLFAGNRGTHLLSTTHHNRPLTGQDGLYSSSVFNKTENQIILKMVNSSNESQSVTVVLDGIKEFPSKIMHQTLTTEHPETDNTLENPDVIKPQFETIVPKSDRFEMVLPPYSIHAFKITL
ncbi:MAG: alpha-L-arabinofuranosidase C-terminal domain-containing protein [Bacteroidales bacterium]